jgi:purine-binding chemotaxis protein CheW
VTSVCFFLGRQRFGADIGHVKETITVRPITRVFFTPGWIAGIINLRGDVVAIVDLKALLGIGQTELDGETRIVIVRVQAAGKLRTAGLLVDRLAEVQAVDAAELQPAPATLPPETAALTAGVAAGSGGEPLAVLDLVKLFESERLLQFTRRTG